MLVALAVLAVTLVLVWLATRRARARDAAFQARAVHTQAEITDIRWKTVGPLPEHDRRPEPRAGRHPGEPEHRQHERHVAVAGAR
jgi:hypothetical protein